MPTYIEVNRMIGSKTSMYSGRRKMVLRSVSSFDRGAETVVPDSLLILDAWRLRMTGPNDSTN